MGPLKSKLADIEQKVSGLAEKLPAVAADAQSAIAAAKPSSPGGWLLVAASVAGMLLGGPVGGIVGKIVASSAAKNVITGLGDKAVADLATKLGPHIDSRVSALLSSLASLTHVTIPGATAAPNQTKTQPTAGQAPIVVANQLPPLPQQVVTEQHYVTIDSGATDAAWNKAHQILVNDEPGLAGPLQRVRNIKNQILSGNKPQQQ